MSDDAPRRISDEDNARATWAAINAEAEALSARIYDGVIKTMAPTTEMKTACLLALANCIVNVIQNLPEDQKLVNLAIVNREILWQLLPDSTV